MLGGQGLLERYRAQIEQGLRTALAGDGALCRIGRYHIGLEDEQGAPSQAFGKFIRPALVLFTTEQLGGIANDALPAAIGLELIHSFSLIHDDIQDGDRTRRGRPAVWAIWGIAEAINAGDYLHSVALGTAAKGGLNSVQELSRATTAMIEGQSLDLSFEARFVDESDYLGMVDRKTGALFGCAFALGGIGAGLAAAVPTDVIAGLRELGREVGRAFQIQDDLLGIWGDGNALGKPIGSDIRQHKKSFPVAVAYARAQDEDRNRLESVYRADAVGQTDVNAIVDLMSCLGVREDVEAAVDRHSARALDLVQALPFPEDGRRELIALIETLARRDR